VATHFLLSAGSGGHGGDGGLAEGGGIYCANGTLTLTALPVGNPAGGTTVVGNIAVGGDGGAGGQGGNALGLPGNQTDVSNGSRNGGNGGFGGAGGGGGVFIEPQGETQTPSILNVQAFTVITGNRALGGDGGAGGNGGRALGDDQGTPPTTGEGS